MYNRDVAPFSTNGKQSLRHLSEISSGVSLDARLLRFVLRLVRRRGSWTLDHCPSFRLLEFFIFLFYFLGIDIPKGILFFHLILVLDIWILVLTFPARTRVSSFSPDSALRRAKCQTYDGLLSESKCEIEKEILSNFETKFSPLKEDR